MGRDILYPVRRLHGIIHEYKLLRKEQKSIKEHYEKLINSKSTDKKCVFLVMTPTHGNLGDHAIAAAEVAILEQNNIPYIQLTIEDLNRLAEKGMRKVMNGSPIFINGGGNLGTLWYSAEDHFRQLMIQNPKSPIVIFPSTIYYEDTEWGKAEFEKSKLIYNHHKDLHLYARELYSYNIMNGSYRNVKLIPDMVLSLNKCVENGPNRSGCILCLRSDIEKTISEDEIKNINRISEKLFGDNIRCLDMVLPHKVTLEMREDELEAQFNRFRSSELVITDRLHAMIFSAISGTPCILINSKSPKVKGCYEWVKHLDYIKFADNVEDIERLYNEIPKGKHIYDNSHLQHMYDELEKDILGIVR